jgi:hypothetical protein
MGRRALLGGLAVAAVLLAALGLLLNLWLGAATCNEDGSSCIESRERVPYQGRLFDFRGRPLGEARVEIRLPTLQEPREKPVTVTLTADEGGRFCFLRWQEPGAAVIHATNGTPGRTADPRYEDPGRFLRGRSRYTSNSRVLVVPPGHVPERMDGAVRYVSGDVRRIETLVFEGTVETSASWEMARDRAERCPELAREPEWDRVEDLERNWRYRLLIGLPLGAMLLGGGAAFARNRTRRRLVIATVAAAAVNTILLALVWYLDFI